MQPEGGYRAVGQEEGVPAQHPRRKAPLQCVAISILIVSGFAILATSPSLARPFMQGQHAIGQASNSTRGKRRGKRRAFLTIGRMGTSSSFVSNFVLRSKPRKIKAQKAKAATKSVVLIGSHFQVGHSLLEGVFRDLCARTRLGLKCEREGAKPKHDLKALSAYKGRKRLVWMERDAGTLLQTLRGVSKYAYDIRVVHLLWDPREACVAQWPLTLEANVSLPSLCQALRMDSLAPLYRRCQKKEKARALQLRLEDLVAKKSGPQAWRQLFKFLALPEKEHDLSTMAFAAAQQKQLRSRVHNSGAPGWVRETISQNSTLHSSLKKLRRQLEYTAALSPSAQGRMLSSGRFPRVSALPHKKR
mgnify:FL=1|tara:strand:+ start:194 stop:1273 length:1080 start_codon:yes stop_codon:yes gene_type:complete